MDDPLTKSQREIMGHALACDQYGEQKYDRNYFVCDPDSADGKIIAPLVTVGLMVDLGSQGELTGGMNLYRVTENGKRIFFAYCPKKPKLSRGQERYEAYLRADSSMTFGEYLKSLKHRDPNPFPARYGSG